MLDFLIFAVSVLVGTTITIGAFIIVRHMNQVADDEGTRKAARSFGIIITVWVLVAWWRTTVAEPLPVKEIFERGPTAAETLLALSLTLIPLFVYAIGRRRSEPFNRLIHLLDPRILVGAQFYRMSGIIFLLFALDKQMPNAIGIPTGIAAFGTGLLGFMLYLFARVGQPWWRQAVKAWSCFGLGYFSYASVTSFGAAMGWWDFGIDPEPVFDYPIAFISSFGLPFSIIAHLMTHAVIPDRAVPDSIIPGHFTES